jgi:hypothetical protein
MIHQTAYYRQIHSRLFHIFRLCKNPSNKQKRSEIELSFRNAVLFIIQIKRQEFIAVIIKSIERKLFGFQLFFKFLDLFDNGFSKRFIPFFCRFRMFMISLDLIRISCVSL